MNADVIIVGAGIIGASCAHAFAERGLDVLLLDDQRGGATAAGMGHLVVMDDNPAELALSQYSLSLWRQLTPQLADDCAYRNCGTLWLAANDAELAVAEQKRALLEGEGLDCRLLTASAVQQAEPMLRPGLAGGLYVSGDGIVYAPNVLRWLLAQHPARIRQQSARAVEVAGNRLRLDSGEWLSAEVVVMATGSARELCPELPIRAKKGHLLITDRYPAGIRHQLVELGYVSSAHSSSGTSVAFNAQPRPTGQILIGSSRQFDSLDPAVELDVLARMLQRAIDYLPGLAQMNAIRSWTGFRAATPDSLPLLGPHPTQPGLWLALGHEGLGVTTAPASAQLLANLVCNQACAIDPTPYSPQRFALAEQPA
ncbi:glycine/D-amino acid oxidase-like deaminating enzyme [Pseudomonas sp. TE3786]